MKLPVTKAYRDDIENERDRKLMKIVSIAMHDGLRHTPVMHAKSLHKIVAEYMEICAILDHTYLVYEGDIEGMNEL